MIPLIYTEESTSEILKIKRKFPDMVIWWGTRLECISAVERNFYEGKFSPELRAEITHRLTVLVNDAVEIQPVAIVCDRAERLIAVHHLKAADALQLAAALLATGERTKTNHFVCLDKRLSFAAANEGFMVLPAQTV